MWDEVRELRDQVVALTEAELEPIDRAMAGVEMIKKWRVLRDEWQTQVDAGKRLLEETLTPIMSNLLEIKLDQIEQMFTQAAEKAESTDAG